MTLSRKYVIGILCIIIASLMIIVVSLFISFKIAKNSDENAIVAERSPFRESRHDLFIGFTDSFTDTSKTDTQVIIAYHNHQWPEIEKIRITTHEGLFGLNESQTTSNVVTIDAGRRYIDIITYYAPESEYYIRDDVLIFELLCKNNRLIHTETKYITWILAE